MQLVSPTLYVLFPITHPHPRGTSHGMSLFCSDDWLGVKEGQIGNFVHPLHDRSPNAAANSMKLAPALVYAEDFSPLIRFAQLLTLPLLFWPASTGLASNPGSELVAPFNLPLAPFVDLYWTPISSS